jgi:hypothetical protein
MAKCGSEDMDDAGVKEITLERMTTSFCSIESMKRCAVA